MELEQGKLFNKENLIIIIIVIIIGREPHHTITLEEVRQIITFVQKLF